MQQARVVLREHSSPRAFIFFRLLAFRTLFEATVTLGKVPRKLLPSFCNSSLNIPAVKLNPRVLTDLSWYGN